LGNSTSLIPYKKKRIEDLRYREIYPDSVMLYEDEKGGPIVVAKARSGTSWSSTTQSRVSKAQQKTNGILNPIVSTERVTLGIHHRLASF
jgi:hypothetical protein